MKEWQVASLILGLIVAGFTLLILGSLADDTTTWEQIDDQGQCYVKAQHERNFVGTPGESRTTRTTYCRP